MIIGRNRIVMNILDIKTTVIALGSSFVIGVASSWWITSEYKDAKHSKVISTMQLQAAEALDQARVKALAIERENNRLATELEVSHNEFRKSLDSIQADNARLSTELGGLYDSKATCTGSTSGSSGTAPSNPSKPSTGAKLSKEASGFLLSESRRADEAAAYARTCYQWIQKLENNR